MLATEVHLRLANAVMDALVTKTYWHFPTFTSIYDFVPARVSSIRESAPTMEKSMPKKKVTLFFFYKEMNKLARHYPRLRFGLVVTLLIQNALFLLSAFLVKGIFDVVTHSKDHALFLVYFCSMFLCVTCTASTYFLTDYLSVKLGTKMLNRLRYGFYQKLHNIALKDLHSMGSGNVLSTFSEDFALLRTATNFSLWYSKAYLLFIPAGIIFLAYFNWSLTVIIVAVIPLFSYLSKLCSRHVSKHLAVKKLHDSRALSFVREEISSQLMCRVLRLESRRQQQFVTILDGINTTEPQQQFTIALTKTTVSSGQLIIRIGALALGSYWVLIGQMTVSALIAYTVLLNSVTACINLFAGQLTHLVEAAHALANILKLTEWEEKKTGKNQFIFENLKSHITFNNVSVQKEGREILKNLHVTINKGQYIAIIGSSGAGKTTLLELLLGEESPTEGEILIDNHRLQDYSMDTLLKNMGVVLHNPCIFEMSIMENIRLGKLDASDEEVYAAAGLAEIHNEIMLMPNGYQTLITEQGNNLSAGQRQRIAIARALINKPSLLLLDEVTVNLDPVNKRSINDTLRKIAQLSTTIRITHELAEAEEVDAVYVLEHGKLKLITRPPQLVADGFR